MGTYGSTSEYLTPIPSNKYEAGVAPLDSLPADWWNWLWQNITRNNDYTATFLNSIFSEINSVLSAAGVTPSGANTDDLKVAIERMCAKVANGEVAGSVLSSELSGRLHVNTDGTADINGLGTPSSLNTTATNVVAAINEVLAMAEGKAPIHHASTGCSYGVIDSFIETGADGCPVYTDANSGKCFGHVGLMAPNWDNCPYISDFTMSQFYNSAPSYAAHWNHRWNHLANATTPGHVFVTTGNGLSNEGGRISMAPNVRSVVFNNTTYTPDTNGCINLGAAGNSFPGYGTNVGRALGTASAGKCTLVARADHVHPISCCLVNSSGSVQLQGVQINIVQGTQRIFVCNNSIAIWHSDGACIIACNNTLCLAYRRGLCTGIVRVGPLGTCNIAVFMGICGSDSSGATVKSGIRILSSGCIYASKAICVCCACV